MNFNLDGDSLPPADPDECIAAYSDPAHPRPDAVVGILVFDVWVLNSDRHSRNLALDFSVSPTQLHVFDHSHALFGREGIDRLKRMRHDLAIAGLDPASGNRHCLINAVRSIRWFRFWIDRIIATPRYVIADAVERVLHAGLITPKEASAAIEILWFRRERLVAILNENHDQFPHIRQDQWGQL